MEEITFVLKGLQPNYGNNSFWEYHTFTNDYGTDYEASRHSKSTWRKNATRDQLLALCRMQAEVDIGWAALGSRGEVITAVEIYEEIADQDWKQVLIETIDHCPKDKYEWVPVEYGWQCRVKEGYVPVDKIIETV